MAPNQPYDQFYKHAQQDSSATESFSLCLFCLIVLGCLTAVACCQGDDEKWMKHTLSWLDKPYVEDAKVILKYRSVIDQPLDKDTSACQHLERSEGTTVTCVSYELPSGVNNVIERNMAAGQNQWHHFGVGEFTTH